MREQLNELTFSFCDIMDVSPGVVVMSVPANCGLHLLSSLNVLLLGLF